MFGDCLQAARRLHGSNDRHPAGISQRISIQMRVSTRATLELSCANYIENSHAAVPPMGRNALKRLLPQPSAYKWSAYIRLGGRCVASVSICKLCSPAE